MFLVKIAISIIAMLLIVSHFIWPAIQVDAITIALIIIALAPWFIGLVKSAKLPGGWEITFRDLKEASDNIKAEKNSVDFDDQPRVHETVDINETDANLALVSVRIEIEKRLRTLAKRHGVDPSGPLTKIFHGLRVQEVLSHTLFDSLEEIVSAGNRAAHGAAVEPSVLQWARHNGWKIIGGLDALINKG